MMTSAKTSTTQFTNAVDFFFGHNPSNPYWALVALAMRKVGHLEIVEEITDEEGLVVLDENTPYFKSESEPDVHIVCHTENPGRIYDILSTIREYESHTQSGSIFSRNQWERSILLNFASALIKLDDQWLAEYFDKCFAVLVRRAFANSQLEQFIQPGDLVTVLGHIVKAIAPDANVVYNPFSGMSSYALHIPKGATYIGEEINPLVAAIANLRLYVKGINGTVYNINAVNDHDYDANLIVSTPPFGLRVRPSDVQFPLERVFTTEALVLRKCLKRSIPAVVVVPRGFNFRKDSALSVRQELIESGNLDMIINLPEKVFSNTAIGTSIYVLNPKHNHKGYVRFIDATKSFSDGFHIRLLDTDAIINIIDNGGEKSKLVSIDVIRENEYNLSPERYFSEDICVPAGMTLKKVSELGDIIQVPAPAIPEDGKFVNFSVLKNPNPIKIYRPEDFENVEIPMNRHINLIHSGLLFFGGRGNLGICITTEGETLYTYSDYINFVPDEAIVLPQYLLIQFQKEYVIEQLPGEIIGRMPVDVFQNIRILVPTLEVQKQIIEDYQERLISELGLEVSTLKTEKFEEMERNLHLRRHTLGNLLNVLLPSVDILKDFISDQEGTFSKDKVISTRTGLTLEKLVTRIHDSFGRVETLVNKLTDSDSFGIPEEVNIQEFITDFVNHYPQSNFRIIPIDSKISLSEDEDKIVAPLISFSREDLYTVFDNIVTNAHKYGFANTEKLDNIVGIRFSLDTSVSLPYVLIQIMNNGAPLVSNLDPDKIFAWGVGSGSGSGLGGWHIKRLVEHFGGTVRVCQYSPEASDCTADYTLGYEISLPLISKGV
ncbi:MAG: N-6 DNA methylase [Lachnospiraceae bacterium]|nr:N-6 DNA methylase [Lachnospiraceae bacterium]